MQHVMRQIIKDTNIDFMGKRQIALIVSGALVLIALLMIAVRSLNWGLDFTGGTMVEVGYRAPVEIAAIRDSLDAGDFSRAQAQHFGTASEVLIRIPPSEDKNSAEISTAVLEILKSDHPEVEIRRVEFVGPQVGEELVEEGGLAMLAAIFGILIYVALRFEWRLALGTIAALVHDAVITIGVFAMFQLEFDLTVLAAILAVIGYSVNDSVVVLDRIRENFRKMRKGTTIEIMNRAINQTLSRTLMTSGTTLLAVIALLILGGPVIRNFSLALLIGIIIGTYSSVYIASASALQLGLNREDLLPQARQTVDDRP